MRALAAILVGLVTWLAAGSALADPTAATSAFAEARAALAAHQDDAGIVDEKPEASAVLRRVWAAAEAVAAQSGGRQAQLTAALSALDKDMGVHVARLDATTLLVGLEIDASGDVFIVRNGVVAWRLGDTHGATAAEFKPLLAWAETWPLPACGPGGQDSWAQCDDISPSSLGQLPDGVDGARRFWIAGRYAQEVGETESGQISFWTWDGARPAPLMVRVFQFHIELDGEPTLVGNVLTVPTKGDFRNFTSGGASGGRQRLWRFRLTANGVQDLGQTSLVTELDLIDELFDRASHHRSLAGLASPAAATVIARVAASVNAADSAQGGPATGWSMGMLDGWRLSSDHRRLCLATDDGGEMVFTLARTRARTTGRVRKAHRRRLL